jgi:hypothetical protein
MPFSITTFFQVQLISIFKICTSFKKVIVKLEKVLFYVYALMFTNEELSMQYM